MPNPFTFTATAFDTVDLTSGKENLPPRANKPEPARLLVAENARFTQKGGVQNRLGFQQKADLSTSSKVDHITTLPSFNVMVAKSGTTIKQSTDGVDWYDTGLTQTAGESTFLFPYGKDVYATNQTDAFTRIAFSSAKVTIADTDTEITVRTGDIGQFASGGGNVYINGDVIAYTGVNATQLTGVTGIASGGHAINSIITQTTTPSGAPKGRCMAELQAHALVGGQSGVGTTLSISLPSNPDEPSLFYDFNTVNGATQKTLPSNITVMHTGKGGVLIGMENGIEVALDFNDQFGGALITRPVSRVHSIPNQLCIADMGEKLIVLTTDGRVLPVQDTDAGFIIIEDEEVPSNNFDYPISRFILDNKDGTDNSKNWIFYDPGTRTVHATILMDTGITQTFVYQRDVGAWSIDTSKGFSYMTCFKGRVYAGSDSDDKIYLDNELRTDALVPIISIMTTGILSLDQRRVTADWLNEIFGGLLSHPGELTYRIAIDGEELVEETVTSDDLINKNLMSITSGVYIGGGMVGAEGVGTAGNLTEAFRFTLPYEFMAEGESIQVEIEISDESTAFELRDLRIEGESEGELLLQKI